MRKSIWKHEQTIRQAETILAEEHGTRHKEGEHELCPKCRELKERTALRPNAKGEARAVSASLEAERNDQ